MKDVEYTRKKSGLLRNKHYTAGTISGLGIGIYVGCFANDSTKPFFFIGAAILWFAGLVYEAIVTNKVVKERRIDRKKALVK